jgi:hypothetical protein
MFIKYAYQIHVEISHITRDGPIPEDRVIILWALISVELYFQRHVVVLLWSMVLGQR